MAISGNTLEIESWAVTYKFQFRGVQRAVERALVSPIVMGIDGNTPRILSCQPSYPPATAPLIT